LKRRKQERNERKKRKREKERNKEKDSPRVVDCLWKGVVSWIFFPHSLLLVVYLALSVTQIAL
jgi:hypothetical protein